MGVRQFYKGHWIEPNISAREYEDELDNHAGTSFLSQWMPLPDPPVIPMTIWDDLTKTLEALAVFVTHNRLLRQSPRYSRPANDR